MSDIHSAPDKLDPKSHATWMRVIISKYDLTNDEAEKALAKCRLLHRGYGHVLDSICIGIKKERPE